MRGKTIIFLFIFFISSCTDQSEFFIKDEEVLFGKKPTVEELDDLDRDKQIEVVKGLCEGEVISKPVSVTFSSNYSSCPWNTGDNGDKINGKVTARVEREVVFDLPKNIAICEISFNSPQSNMYYDDDFYLLLNNAVLATNNWMVSEGYEDSFGVPKTIFNSHSDYNYYIYDWSKLFLTPAKQPTQGNAIHAAGYCLGRDKGSTCRWPTTQDDGVIQVAIASEKIKEIMLGNLGNPQHSIKFVVTGDNDPSTDCASSEVKFDLNITYAQLAE